MSAPDLFVLTIALGNAEMCEPRHVADALRNVADRIEQIDGTLGKLRIADINGNTVGGCWTEITEASIEDTYRGPDGVLGNDYPDVPDHAGPVEA